MKIEPLIPIGWRWLEYGEKIRRGDYWLMLNDARIGDEWYAAYDEDPDANMVGHPYRHEDDTPTIFIRRIPRRVR